MVVMPKLLHMHSHMNQLLRLGCNRRRRQSHQRLHEHDDEQQIGFQRLVHRGSIGSHHLGFWAAVALAPTVVGFSVRVQRTGLGPVLAKAMR